MNYKRLVALALTVTSLSLQAEERWFDVELLLFKRNVDIQNITEHLSSEQIVIDSNRRINLLKTMPDMQCPLGETCLSSKNPTVITSAQFDNTGSNFERLSSSQLQLTPQRQQLEKHARFTPLLHMGWRMPTVSGRIAKPIHIFAGNNLGKVLANQNMPEQLNLNTLIANDGILEVTSAQDTTSSIEDKWEVDGNFKVYLDHYLFIDSQLIIRKAVKETIQQIIPNVELIDDENGVQIAKPLESNAVNTQTVQQTVIKESLFDQNRRLRSEEIHYLDHPLMGILVQIRKIPAAELTLGSEAQAPTEQHMSSEPVSSDLAAPVKLQSNGESAVEELPESATRTTEALPVSPELMKEIEMSVSEDLPEFDHSVNYIKAANSSK